LPRSQLGGLQMIRVVLSQGSVEQASASRDWQHRAEAIRLPPVFLFALSLRGGALMKALLAGMRAQAGASGAAAASSRSERLAAATVAAMLGLSMLWGVGFSHVPAWHNAAHDTRHSMAFPCH
jgi:cobalt transporter subunit CbtB